MARDRILISELRVDCIVGVFDHERLRPQPLLIDLELGLDTAEAAYSGRIAATCDYGRVADEIATLLEFRRYKLLEVAAGELAAMLIGVHPMIEDVRLRLRKPEALPGRATMAGVEVYRAARELLRMRERNEFGEVELLHQSREAGLYLLHIDPQREIPAHYHQIMRELEWLVDGAIERDGERLHGFEPIVWREQRVHHYVNVGDQRATLFCCDSPPFVPEDEIVVGS
ncbi:Dihydroneopterin aldolase [Enhygromyxa salina]|uniref:7,8-dihydroneopterin aldolase n=1 Tax=Enhygromyxa salina TaxID=215803 RepID=A0A0C2CKC9_9BACT|nr:dihydroneopterin aldolase [Enhygromyxa salina]KIG11676.1 Dihydroneopterin aldolase [Enhygromyxa salina]